MSSEMKNVTTKCKTIVRMATTTEDSMECLPVEI